jgi:hypothetical protein
VAFGSCETGACVTGVCPSFVGEGEPCGGGNVVCSVFRGFAVGELFCSIQDDCSEICERLLL